MMKLSIAFYLLLISTFTHAQNSTNSTWHEYCYMTVHVKVTGWIVDKSEEIVSIPINANTLSCHVSSGQDFLGQWSTSAEVRINANALSLLSTNLRVKSASAYVAGFDGIVDDSIACEKVDEMIASAKLQGGFLQAKVSRDLIRQDWTSSKNVDVYLREKMTIELDGGVQLISSNSLRTRGEFCAKGE